MATDERDTATSISEPKFNFHDNDSNSSHNNSSGNHSPAAVEASQKQMQQPSEKVDATASNDKPFKKEEEEISTSLPGKLIDINLSPNSRVTINRELSNSYFVGGENTNSSETKNPAEMATVSQLLYLQRTTKSKNNSETKEQANLDDVPDGNDEQPQQDQHQAPPDPVQPFSPNNPNAHLLQEEFTKTLAHIKSLTERQQDVAEEVEEGVQMQQTNEQEPVYQEAQELRVGEKRDFEVQRQMSPTSQQQQSIVCMSPQNETVYANQHEKSATLRVVRISEGIATLMNEEYIAAQIPLIFLPSDIVLGSVVRLYSDRDMFPEQAARNAVVEMQKAILSDPAYFM